MTTKTVRHYEKGWAAGSAAVLGGRLPALRHGRLAAAAARPAAAVSRPLPRPDKGGLGEPGADAGLLEVLEALLVEVEGQLAPPEERQERTRETLDREDPELPEGSLGPEVGEGVPGRLP